MKKMLKLNFIMCALMLVACSGNASNKEKAEESRGVNAEGMILEDNEKEEVIEEALPFSGDEVREHVVLDYGNRTVRSDADKSIILKQSLVLGIKFMTDEEQTEVFYHHVQEGLLPICL